MPRTALTDTQVEAGRARILAAALKIVGSDGLEALSMRSLADAVALTPGALYRYFANKDEVIEAIFGGGTALDDRLLAIADGRASDLKAVRRASRLTPSSHLKMKCDFVLFSSSTRDRRSRISRSRLATRRHRSLQAAHRVGHRHRRVPEVRPGLRVPSALGRRSRRHRAGPDCPGISVRRALQTRRRRNRQCDSRHDELDAGRERDCRTSQSRPTFSGRTDAQWLRQDNKHNNAQR